MSNLNDNQVLNNTKLQMETLMEENLKLKSENKNLKRKLQCITLEKEKLESKLKCIRSDRDVIFHVMKHSDSPIDSLSNLFNNGTILHL